MYFDRLEGSWGVFDEWLCELFVVGGGEEVHGVDDGAVEVVDFLLLLFDLLVVEVVEVVHALYDLAAEGLEGDHFGVLFAHLSPKWYFEL